MLLNTQYKRTATSVAKKVFHSHENDINDIILFGSTQQGKANPNNITILIIFKHTINKDAEQLFKKLAKLAQLDINSTTTQEVANENFITKESMYLEGKSLLNNKAINDTIGFTSIASVKYDLKNITGSKRIMFYYALNGRNNKKGFLHTISAQRFAEKVIVCDYSVIDKLKSFLEYWNIKHTLIPTLIPQRLKHTIINT